MGKRLFDVSEFMRNLEEAFARWFNRLRNRRGHFWAARFWERDGKSFTHRQHPQCRGLLQRPVFLDRVSAHSAAPLQENHGPFPPSLVRHGPRLHGYPTQPIRFARSMNNEK